MKFRFLGTTGVRVSELIFGCMSFGGDADEDTARLLFDRARDAGINTFDLADVYSGGRAEEIFGALAADCRDELVVMTKAYFPTGPGPNQRGGTRVHLRRAVEASLRRLRTDRIDVFFLHRFDDVTALEDTLRTVDDLVGSGKILYPAVSNFAAWQAQKALGIAALRGWAPICAVQPMYNLVKRQAEVEILPMARAENLAVLPYSPLAAGLLSGKYGRQQSPAHGRIVDSKMYEIRYAEPAYRDVAERFTALARARGQHPVELAIAWVASHPAVTAPIIGARDVGQLDQALRSTEIELDDALRAEISALSPAPPPATDRNEEASEHNFGAR